MKSRHDSELMALADGEVNVSEVEGIDAVARQKMQAVGELGELVRGHLELSAESVPAKKFDALWREIDKSLERAAATDKAPTTERAQPSLLRRIGRWFDHYRGHIITGAVSAGAVAALALVLRNPSDETTKTPIDVKPAALRPAEIESLDTPGGTGTVFNLEDEDGSTTVIWVTPEDTVEGI